MPRQAKVLLVDDDLDFVEATKTVLENKYQVITASNGDDGLKKVVEENPDLIILDAIMPGKTGLAVCKELKGDPHYRPFSKIPVLLLTVLPGGIEETNISPCEGACMEAEGYVQKPVKPEELLKRAEELLKKQGGNLMPSLKTWFFETRPHFLLLIPVCVFVGIAVAVYESPTNSFNVLHFVLAFLGGLLAHISVNVLNDYFDYRSGIDLKTRRTPFSGGSGILPAGLLSARSVYLFGVGCLLATTLIGVYFIYKYRLDILPIGILGILLVYFYTTHLTKNPLLCAIAPGLGFGLVALGTSFTQTGDYTLAAIVAMVVPGLLISNLLLLNQFPDVEADKVASRRHLPIAIGRRGSAKVYTGLIVATYLWIILWVALGVLPITALLGLITLPLGLKTVRGVLQHAEDVDNLVPFMGRNIQITLLTPLLMGVGIFLGLLLS